LDLGFCQTRVIASAFSRKLLIYKNNKMEQKEMSISGLYYRYKKTSDDNIRKHLSNIKIVVLENKGVGTIQGYYPLSDESMVKILEKPRNISLSFDATETAGKPIENLKEYKTIKYLVKSTSRFFLKPDVGEIFDQIDYRDLFDSKIKAIQYLYGAYETLPDTDGEHFVMEAKLLVDAGS
jgi:hypothetical protein